MFAANPFTSDSGHLDVLDTLISEKADVNIKNKYGSTALMVSYYRKDNTIETLIQAGAIVNETDSEGNTALMRSSQGQLKAVAVLIEKAKVVGSSTGIADDAEYTTYINMKNNDGKTALILATELEEENWGATRTEIIKILKDAGAKE